MRVTARAGHTAVTGIRDGRLHVRVAAAPVDGAANDALVRLLANAMGIAPRQVRGILAGEHTVVSKSSRCRHGCERDRRPAVGGPTA